MDTSHLKNRYRGIEVTILGLAVLVFLSFCSSQSSPSQANQNNANRPNVETNQPAPGVTVFALEPAPVLGIVVDRNMQVVHVEKGSAAEKGGIKKGDILKGVNSKIVTQPNAAREAFYSINSSQKSRLVILRDGKELTLEIRPAAPATNAGQQTPTPVPQDMTYF